MESSSATANGESHGNLPSPSHGVSGTPPIKRMDLTFKPNAHHPYQEMVLKLSTEAANRIFERTYNPATQAIYFLFCTTPAQVRSRPELVDKLLNEMYDKFTDLEKRMADELARLNVLIKDTGAGPLKGYFNDVSYEFVVLAPECYRFFGLIDKMNDIVVALDRLWFAGSIKPAVRRNTVTHWRNEIVKFGRLIFNTSVKAKGMAQAERKRALERVSKKENGSRKSSNATAPSMEAIELTTELPELEAFPPLDAEESIEADSMEDAPQVAKKIRSPRKSGPVKEIRPEPIAASA